MPIAPPDPALVARFRDDLAALTGSEPGPVGIAVSGGPDSLALLLLAAAAWPGQVRAATVDHGLRPESAAEARFVAAICADLGVPHDILSPAWTERPRANVAAVARAARYAALAQWAGQNGIVWLATAHHLDDQAETFLMRAARGSGVAGLAGVRAVNPLGHGGSGSIVRPLLGWRKAELLPVVAAAGLTAMDDPTNSSDELDRTHVRRLLAATGWLDPVRVAASAAYLADADEALRWATAEAVTARLRRSADGTGMIVDPRGLPRELQRRLLLQAFAALAGGEDIPGPKLMTLLDALRGGRAATLAGIKAEPGETWLLSPAPPRKS